MTAVGQTPGTFVLAGGVGLFSASCIAALARAGFEPEDFGSYSHTLGRIRGAKARMLDHQLATRAANRNGTPLPPPPSDRDRFLAGCQAGHIRQNALFQRERGNSCQNERASGPNHPGATGYQHDLAPCGPSYVGTGKGNVGTTHWAQGQSEARLRTSSTPADAPISEAQIRENSVQSSNIAASGAPDGMMPKGKGGATRRRGTEAKRRAASAEEAKASAAGKPGGAAPPGSPVADAQTAAECIEAFATLGMDAMRQQVMNDYSSQNYAATKKRLEEAEAAAAARLTSANAAFNAAKDQAKNNLNGQGPERWDDVSRAGVAKAQAKQDFLDARNANASASCLAAQAVSLNAAAAANGGALPPMSGSIPGAVRPKY